MKLGFNFVRTKNCNIFSTLNIYCIYIFNLLLLRLFTNHNPQHKTGFLFLMYYVDVSYHWNTLHSAGFWILLMLWMVLVVMVLLNSFSTILYSLWVPGSRTSWGRHAICHRSRHPSAEHPALPAHIGVQTGVLWLTNATTTSINIALTCYGTKTSALHWHDWAVFILRSEWTNPTWLHINHWDSKSTH